MIIGFNALLLVLTVLRALRLRHRRYKYRGASVRGSTAKVRQATVEATKPFHVPWRNLRRRGALVQIGQNAGNHHEG
jgi:hypothetical protein